MKTPRSLFRSLFVCSFSLAVLATAQASAQTVITSVPYTINASGRYTLGGNLNQSAAGPAIIIAAPNVILDLNGYYVAGPGASDAPSTSSSSVIFVAGVANVVIRNGTVAGNVYGIFFGANSAAVSRNYVVDSVTVTRCYQCGVYFGGGIPAPGSRVRNCSFSTIGNSTYSANTDARAILVYGGVRVENNNIGDVTATGTGNSFGIGASPDNFIIGNTISNCKYGVNGGKRLNNLTYNVDTPFQAGTNANGNN